MNRSTILAGVLCASIGSGALVAQPAKGADAYAKDATLAFFDIAPLKSTGWDEYAAEAAKVFAGFSSIKVILNEDLQARRRGNVAWGTTTARIDVVNKDGTKLPLEVRWTLIWEKRGNDWLIVHEHASIPLPEPAAPATTR